MRRSAKERERLKAWAMDWRPQPTHDRLNRYRKLRFKNWSDYMNNRTVLNLTPEQRRKAQSIYNHLLRKHHAKVIVRGEPYTRMLRANAVSRCRKKISNRREHRANTHRLLHWQKRAYEEGFGNVPGHGKSRDESLKRLEEENRLANLGLHKTWDE